MTVDSTRIQELIEHPAESLSVEIKSWIDPSTEQGQAKIIRAALAHRNHDGGYLVIGFDDKTLQPSKAETPGDIRTAFHIDVIQGLVSKYASEAFEVKVEFPTRDGQAHPVIVIPAGVRSPVAAKSELSAGVKKLISVDDVYVRTLGANNTPSTAKAACKDWPAIIGICMDNREADIGRFLRRHLGGLTPDILRDFASAIAAGAGTRTTTKDQLNDFLQESRNRRKTVMSEGSYDIPQHGSWEVALLLRGNVPGHSATRKFLNLLDSSNPNYTGWPIWLSTAGFPDPKSHPYVFNDTWEAFAFVPLHGFIDTIDFMILDPGGRFYLYRALEDDMAQHHRAALAPMSELDFALPVLRTAEAIAVGMAFAKAMGCPPENTVLAFGFFWTGLKGRQLGSWANPGHLLRRGGKAHQDEVQAYVDVPLDTPPSALSEFVAKAVAGLHAAFDGFSLDKSIIENLTRRLMERRL